MSRKILYLHPHFVLPGGAGRFVIETANELSDRGWEAHVASIRADLNFIEGNVKIKFHNLGGPLSDSILYWLYLPLLLIKVIILIKQIKPDVVFSQVFPANWWGFIAKMLLGNTIFHVWMCQEPSAFIHSSRWIKALPMSLAGILARTLNPILKLIDIYLSKFKDLVFANSKFSQNLAIQAYSYQPNKVGICYPGVDLDRFIFSDMSKRINYQFVTCCRLTKFKNIDKVINAFSFIKNDKVSLVIIGNGEEYNNLIELSENLKVSNKVKFCKTVTDQQMVELLQNSFALIHPALEEPFGLVPVEAMACGTPVIAMHDGGPSETVVHKQTGYLCENPSEGELLSAVNWLINYPAFETISLECKNRAQLFTWKKAVDTLESAFDNRHL